MELAAELLDEGLLVLGQLDIAFRAQLDLGMWAAVPTATKGKREAQLVRSFEEIPRDADRVIFFPRAAGGR